MQNIVELNSSFSLTKVMVKNTARVGVTNVVARNALMSRFWGANCLRIDDYVLFVLSDLHRSAVLMIREYFQKTKRESYGSSATQLSSKTQ